MTFTICDTHVRHPNPRAARYAKRKLERETGTTGLQVWRCPACQCWHCGHKRRRR